jgi:hypothetical protein
MLHLYSGVLLLDSQCIHVIYGKGNTAYTDKFFFTCSLLSFHLASWYKQVKNKLAINGSQ